MHFELGDRVRFVRRVGTRYVPGAMRGHAEKGEVGVVCDVNERSISVELIDDAGFTYALVEATIDYVELVVD